MTSFRTGDLVTYEDYVWDHNCIVLGLTGRCVLLVLSNKRYSAKTRAGCGHFVEARSASAMFIKVMYNDTVCFADSNVARIV